jgi:hypothetical protein
MQTSSNKGQQQQLWYKPFGTSSCVCAIGFPSAVTSSFGAFGSSKARTWSQKFRAAQLPVRCVVLHSLDLMPDSSSSMFKRARKDTAKAKKSK